MDALVSAWEVEYIKAGMPRHVAACAERAKEMGENANDKRSGYFTISITGKYDTRYWMILVRRVTT